MKFIHPWQEKGKNSRKFTKIRQITGQWAQSKVAHPNFAPLDSSPSIENLIDFRAFCIIFSILAALCNELNC